MRIQDMRQVGGFVFMYLIDLTIVVYDLPGIFEYSASKQAL